MEFGQSEIHKDRVALIRYDDVGWFDVAVDNALCMRFVQRVRQLQRDRHAIDEGQRALVDPALEIRALVLSVAGPTVEAFSY